MDCPDDSTLALRLSGALEGALAAEVDAHVESCAVCYELMLALATLVAPSGSEPRGDGAAIVERRIGRYELVAPIGAGGMGVVWRARDPELRREVAVKVHAVAAPRLRERMIREAQAMARLAHANIVEVYDVVVEPERVCIVMALVRGRDAAAWARERPHRVDETLAVYRSAAAGLAAAHAVGIVHRDVKPHNLLVADDGRVMVADFGLAIADEGTVSEPVVSPGDADELAARARAAITRTGAFVGTPRYMAPEQLAGGTATRESDQFALAVGLFEALFDRLPFADADRTRARVELPTERPVPATVRRALVRALDPDPARRFPTVAGFAGALQPATGVRRFWPAIATGLATAALVGAAAMPATPAPSCTPTLAWNDDVRGRIAAAFAATTVADAAALAERTEVELARWADAWESTHAQACEAGASDRDRVLDCLDGRRRRFEALVADLELAELATVHAAANAPAELPAPSECISTASSDPIADVRDQIAIARGHRKLARFPAAREALAVAETSAADRPLARAAVDVERGHLAADLADRDAAATAFRAGFFTAREHGDDELAIDAALALALLDMHGERIADARAWIAHARALVGPDASAQTQAELAIAAGNAALTASEPDVAVREFERAVALSADSERTITAPLGGLCMALSAAGRYDEADAACERAVATGLARYGEDDRVVAKIRYAWGTNLLERGRADEALPHLQRALAVQRKLLGEHHPHVAECLLAIGMAEHGRGELAAAERDVRRGLELCAQIEDSGACTIAALLHLAQVLETKGDLDGALATLRRAEDQLALVAAADTYLASVVAGAIGAVLVARGELELAIPRLERAHAICLALFGADHPNTVNGAQALADATSARLRARSGEPARR